MKIPLQSFVRQIAALCQVKTKTMHHGIDINIHIINGVFQCECAIQIFRFYIMLGVDKFILSNQARVVKCKFRYFFGMTFFESDVFRALQVAISAFIRIEIDGCIFH